MIEDIGSLTGKETATSLLKTGIENEFKTLKTNRKPTPFRVCYLIWKDPYLTVGGDTFIHDMLEACGFENVFAHQYRYPQVTIEMLHQLNCEAVFLSSEPYPFREAHRQALQKELPGINVILVDGTFFSWYGSRLRKAPGYFKMLQQELEQPVRTTGT